MVENLAILNYLVENVDDVVRFEKELREEEPYYGWEIDEAYIKSVRASFADPSFSDSISLLAYRNGRVIGRIDSSMIKSHFDGSTKAYLDWICVLESERHQGVAQALLEALRAELKGRGVDTLIALTASNEEAQRFYKSITGSQMHDIGIWIDIK